MALIDNLAFYYSLADVNAAHGGVNLGNNGTATFVSGKVGNAVNLVAASNQYLSVADNAIFSMQDIDFTIALWARAVSFGVTRPLVSKWNSTNSKREWQVVFNSTGQPTINVSNNGTTVATAADTVVSVDTWYFLVAQHDSVNNLISISTNNGTPVTTAHTTGIFDSDTSFRIGRDGGNVSNHNGLIDEVGGWKRLLSGAEITDLYNGGAGRDYAYISGAAGGTVPKLFMNYQRMATP